MAETAMFRGSGGALFEFALPLPALYAEQERKGQLVRVDAPAVPAPAVPAPVVEQPADPAPEAAGDVPERPARADSKADWIAYGLRVSDLSRDDLSAMTKAELVEMFGG